ncbi:hypothetical protein GZ77_04400 [Endozoicomonas montiporae]|uniref:Uncharacterized protein n=2 Tax=Endozoicomonas montiporae TaxID=1027273 RepID=A0A081NBG0_9GAMM|nr:hypothetical protein [Endozoicomonas montiporae]AMO56066.1 hypothetical protein EZMO1_1934 [Endozoicomonas montiporae CL-33]KEQ15783.1 hypothetical protein GZ77_04400 [Endozoicomonas montiporae]
MDKPKVLPILAAFLLFFINTASGEDLEGWLNGYHIFTVSEDDNQIHITSKYSGQKTVVTGEKTSETSEGNDTVSQEESKIEDQPLPNQGCPSTSNDDDNTVFRLFQEKKHLAITPVPEHEDWMIVESRHGTENPVLFHVDDSQGSPQNPYYTPEPPAEGSSFFSRLIVALKDRNNDRIEAKAIQEILRHPVFAGQLDSMFTQGRVTSTSLRAFRIGSYVHSGLGYMAKCKLFGNCLASYKGLTFVTFEIRIKLDKHGNYKLLRITLAIPNASDSLALGAPEYGKKRDDQYKKDDDDDKGGKPSPNGIRGYLANLPFVNLFTGNNAQQSQDGGKGNTGTSDDGKGGKQENSATTHVFKLHNWLVEQSTNGTNYLSEEESWLSIKSQADFNKEVTLKLNANSLKGTIPAAKSGIEASTQPASGQSYQPLNQQPNQQVLGY